MPCERLTLEYVRSLLPVRPEDGHKGTFGHVFVVAGSRGFTGAAKLACEAAGRSGAGLVTAGVPRPLGNVMASALVEPMSYLLPSTGAESFSEEALSPALAFSAKKDAVVLGPGISQHPETQGFVLGFVAQCSVPMLVDADGLNALGRAPRVLLEARGPRVLTPHPGEMARLTGQSTQEVQGDREGVARRFGEAHGCVVVLKGKGTVVTDGKDAWENPTGNAGLGTGGTGDVLSGLIGGLMAQGMAVLEAALLGVYAHGLAGDIAAERKTQRGMVASDVIEAIPEAWRRIEEGVCV